jgi:thiosulfate/3-mercaptopyruvate sulfurtransferase
MAAAMTIEPFELLGGHPAVLFDCRFSLADPEAGRRQYLQGHIPGAHFLDLNRDLSAPAGKHGGRHPLPQPQEMAVRLACYGVTRDTEVVAYDDARLAGSTRLWWLMRSLGYRSPRLLNGGYQAWLAAGGQAEVAVPVPVAGAAPALTGYRGHCDIEGLRQAQSAGALLVDSREQRRYQGLEEPIDPVAGHIPGAVNRPWQGVTLEDGRLRDEQGLRAHWGEVLDAEQLVVYCGSGVTACVNLFSLAALGREDATLYAGSWSDWCSYLPPDT